MSIQAIRGAVESAIARASRATGVDFSFLLHTAGRESGLNPGAKAGSSSAAGLFQFVEQTWLSTLKQHGAKHGYARFAELISKGNDGRYHVSGDEAKKAVLDLRFDPHAAALMAGELTSDHAAYLKGHIGRAPTAGELYAAHFLGPEGSARLIEATHANPRAAAAQLFPEAAHANKAIFFSEGRPRSVAEVYDNLTKASGPGAAVDPLANATDEGFLQYASAGRSDRLRTQDALVATILRGVQPAEELGAGSRLTGSLFTSEMLKLLSDARGRT